MFYRFRFKKRRTKEFPSLTPLIYYNVFFLIIITPAPNITNANTPTITGIIKFKLSPVFGVTITVSAVSSSFSVFPVPGT